MISKVLYVLQMAVLYIRNHPQILFVLVLIVVVPFAFLYSGQQFLDAGIANQEKLEKDRIGLLHDAFASLTEATRDTELIQKEIEHIASLNPDIIKFRLSSVENQQLIPFAALDREVIGQPEENLGAYQRTSVLNGFFIFTEYRNDTRYWQAYRSVQTEDGFAFFIFTETSLAQVDAVMRQNEQTAYYSLAVIYFFILLLAYWHIRNTDYHRLYAESKKANETKDLFTNMIAHELRAPLTAIRGYASMVDESKELKGTSKEYVQRIQLSSERLLSIINDLLDVARIQSGKLSFENVETDLSVVVNSVADELRISAKEKKISIVCKGSDTSHFAKTDAKRLQQALTNMVSNSIKYTKEGEIELEIIDVKDSYEIRIKDTGMGISAEEQKQLFAPFYRVESNDVSTITGTGLGMWITKQLIELMGATIAVESIKGVGTHIVVKIKKA